jgi:hypothetical protein
MVYEILNTIDTAVLKFDKRGFVYTAVPFCQMLAAAKLILVKVPSGWFAWWRIAALGS